MNHITKKLLSLAMLLSIAQAHADTTSGLTYFLPRAQNGTAYDILGWNKAIHKFDADEFYFDFKVQSEWRQSFDSTKLGQYIFFNGTNSMIFGPAAPAAATTDVFSLNFLLPSGFKSTVTANPKVQSSITSFDFYFGLDGWVSGLWVSANLPLVWTRWNTHLTETDITAVPAGGFQAGEVQATALTTTPYANVIQAWKGDKTAGNASIPWKYGRIDGHQSRTRLGEVSLNVGYDFLQRENGHLALALRGEFGAGGKSQAEYVFEPTIGYGGRMGIGGMLDAAVRLWERDEDHNFWVYLTGYATHLFNGNQVRSYDLTACGVGSRYNLVKNLTTITATAPSTYGNIIDNMINIGTRTAKISLDVVYEATLQFSYMTGNVGLDFGYSIGGHGAEKFSKWVDSSITGNYILYDSTNGGNVLNAANQATGATKVTVSGNDTGTTNAAVITSNQTTYLITLASLNQENSLAKSAMGQCIYGNLSYTWKDNDWTPCVSLFADVEFSSPSNRSLNTWGIGLQGNVSY